MTSAKRVRLLLKRLIFCLYSLGFFCLFAQEQFVLRISTENSPDHVQSLALENFKNLVNARSQGRLRVELYTSAQLFRDADVIPALLKGKIEMAVPGTWILGNYLPNLNVFFLPLFYNRPKNDIYTLLKGRCGQDIEQDIKQRLGLEILGDWMDLGYANIFTKNTPPENYESLKNKTIRVAGSRANELRLRALGIQPVSIAWPDFPALLERDGVDGVLSTYETIKSARLWERGLNYILEDRQYYGQYVPLISHFFWARLTPDLQRLLTDTWNEVAGKEKQEAEKAQNDAKTELLAQGFTIYTLNSFEVQNTRNELLKLQDTMIRELRISEALVQTIQAELLKR